MMKLNLVATAAFGAVVVEQAELDAFGDLGEHREVGAEAVVGSTEGVGLARPDLDSGCVGHVGTP